MLENKTVTDLLVTTEAVIRDLGRWEYVYKSASYDCVYKDERGAPSCLIGHVLYRWGALDEVEEGIAEFRLKELEAPSEVGRVADAIQAAQDARLTWGEALEKGRLAAKGLEVAA